MPDVHTQQQHGQQQRPPEDKKQQRPPIPSPNHPVPPVTPEERLEHDHNLAPRIREAHTRQINESFHAPDSLVHSEVKEPQKVEPHRIEVHKK